MNRRQKINFLKSRNIYVADNATDAWLDAEIAKFENRKQNFKGGTINVIFDKADSSPVEVMVYQDIGDDPFGGMGFTAQDFRDALKDVPRNRPIDLRINSAGGNVWDGMAIKTVFDEWPGKKTACIDGMAASVASWLPMTADEIRAPRHAQMFIHDPWGVCIGNPQDMRTQADEMDKTGDQIADMYARKTGKTRNEMRDLMKTGTLFTAEEANKIGLIDKLIDEEPVQNFSALQIRNMRAQIATLNSLKTARSGQPKPQENKMNRKQKIALLNKMGVSVSKNATESFLDKMLGTFYDKVTFKNGTEGDHAPACNCVDCGYKNMVGDDGEDDDDDDAKPAKNAPKPSEETPDADADDGAPGTEGEMFKAATANAKRVDKFLNRVRSKAIDEQFDKFVQDGRIGANEVADWKKIAVAAEDSDDGVNPIMDRLEKTLPKNNRIGVDPVSVEVGDPNSIVDLDRAVTNLMKPAHHLARNGSTAENLHERIMIGQNSKRVGQLINRLKKYDEKNKSAGYGELVGPLREAYDKFAFSPRNSNTMSTGLLRQVILSEVMRAFRRQFTSLTYFAHNFGNVPLEGTDIVQVPYYPLANTASTEFKYSDGYVVNANAVTSTKSITVGGIGNGVASAGSGRKYQSLKFSAYEIRRQPWLDIQKLSVMAGEQLAVDVRADIIGTNINAANFGNAIWTGAAGGFDHTVVGNVLQLAAINAFWPTKGRNVVLAPSYFTNLTIDPALYPYLYSGSTEILNQGVVTDKYGFENILHDPLLPVANFIRGGDGTVTAGTDPNLAGYMCWPSAVLIATAPIMPPPGVLKKLVAYEQITDDQTNLAFTYQFFGNEAANADSEIIECTYGSGLGELKALFRLTSQGN